MDGLDGTKPARPPGDGEAGESSAGGARGVRYAKKKWNEMDLAGRVEMLRFFCDSYEQFVEDAFGGPLGADAALAWVVRTFDGKRGWDRGELGPILADLRRRLTDVYARSEYEYQAVIAAKGWDPRTVSPQDVQDRMTELVRTRIAVRQNAAFKIFHRYTLRKRRHLAPYVALVVSMTAVSVAHAGDGGGSGGSGPGPGPSPWSTNALWSLAIVAIMPASTAVLWHATHGADKRLSQREPARGEHLDRRLNTSLGATKATIIAVESAREEVPGGGQAGASAGPGAAQARRKWTRQVSGVSSLLMGIAWSGSTAVVVGQDGTILSSRDGEAWELVPQPRTYNYTAVAYGNSVFVAVANDRPGRHNGRMISTSPDGRRWTTQADPELHNLTRVVFGNGIFLAVGSQVAMRSVDGETWEPVTTGTSDYLAGLEFLRDRFVIVGQSGIVLTSRDGATWTEEAGHVPMTFVSGAFGNGRYVLGGQFVPEAGREAAVTWTSSDLATWERREQAGVQVLGGATFTGREFVMVGEGISTSGDGVTWTTEVSAASFRGYESLWTGSMVIAVGQEGVIYTSAPVP